jgi:hypothetical protein
MSISISILEPKKNVQQDTLNSAIVLLYDKRCPTPPHSTTISDKKNIQISDGEVQKIDKS